MLYNKKILEERLQAKKTQYFKIEYLDYAGKISVYINWNPYLREYVRPEWTPYKFEYKSCPIVDRSFKYELSNDKADNNKRIFKGIDELFECAEKEIKKFYR